MSVQEIIFQKTSVDFEEILPTLEEFSKSIFQFQLKDDSFMVLFCLVFMPVLHHSVLEEPHRSSLSSQKCFEAISFVSNLVSHVNDHFGGSCVT